MILWIHWSEMSSFRLSIQSFGQEGLCPGPLERVKTCQVCDCCTVGFFGSGFVLADEFQM